MTKTYADYLKTIPSGAVGANGLLGGPSTGANYQAEGMTPEQYYAFMTQQVADPMARDGADGGYRDRGPADASWVGGAQKTGAAKEFWTALPMALSMGAYGAVAGAGEAIGSGMSIGEADAALAAFDASQVGAAAGGGGGLLSTLTSGASTIGKFISDNPTLAKLGGAVLGAASAKDTQTTASQSKDPWAPAQPYLLDNLKTNAAMQEHYRANPFNNEQKTAYQGLLNTVENNRVNAAPMTANANSFMQSNRGRMPAMQGLLSGTQAAPIDWAQYQNIGK